LSVKQLPTLKLDQKPNTGKSCPASYCRVLSPGEFNGMVVESLYSKSFKTLAVTVAIIQW